MSEADPRCLALTHFVRSAAQVAAAVLACLAALLFTACPGPPITPPPDGYTTRIYSAVSYPEELPGGERLILNGNRLLRYSAAGTALGQSVIPFEADSFTEDTSYGWQLSCADEAYLVHDSNYLSRVDNTGKLLWTVRFKSTIIAAQALPGGGVVSYWRGGGSSNDDRLQIHDAAGHEVFGQSYNFANTPSLMAGDGDHIYVSEGGQLLCLDRQGQTRWTQGGTYLGYIEDADASRVLLLGARFACYSAEGALLWTAGEQNSQRGELLPEGEAMLYSVDQLSGSLRALRIDAAGGELGRTVMSPGALQSAVDFGGAGIALTHYDSEGSKLSLFDYEGALLWSFTAPLIPASGSGPLYEEQRQSKGPRLGGDGLIYFESQSVLYALDTNGAVAASYPGSAFYQFTYHAQ